jgi:hypothetical protein
MSEPNEDVDYTEVHETPRYDEDDDARPPTPEYIRCLCDFPGDDPTCPVDHDQIAHERGTPEGGSSQ